MDTTVVISTEYGDMEIKLYDETPLHRENFLKLIKEGFYKDLLFHRVIDKFMIQGGDPSSRGASAHASLGAGDLDYTIPAEFNSKYYHKKGALAAARLGDQMNPTKSSSASQFYIVTGDIVADKNLKNIEKQKIERKKQAVYNELQTLHKSTIKELYAIGDKSSLAELRSNLIEEAEGEVKAMEQDLLYTSGQKDIYTTIGGVPFLDGEYTVFGEVVKGLDVADKIQKVSTNGQDRPLEDIRMDIYIK